MTRERSKAIKSSSTMDAEAIELMEMTSEDVEQGTSFIDASKRGKLLPLRELEGLDKQLKRIFESINCKNY